MEIPTEFMAKLLPAAWSLLSVGFDQSRVMLLSFMGELIDFFPGILRSDEYIIVEVTLISGALSVLAGVRKHTQPISPGALHL